MSPTYSLERKTDRITLAHHLHRLRPQKHWDGWVIWNKIDFAMVYEMKFGQFLLHIQNSVLVIAFYYYWKLACENSRFSSLFAAGDVSRGGTSATQRQKFHTDDANQCLHNKSGSHGVPNTNLSNFTCLLVDFGSVVFIYQRAPAKLKCFLWRWLYSTNIDCFVRDSSRLHLTFVAFCLLSFVFCLSFANNG